MASKRLRRALSTGFETGSGILGAQIQAARDEEKRRRLANQENLASLLGLSLVEQRKARTAKLQEVEPDVEYEIEIAPGFKAKTKTEEGLDKIAKGFGKDVESFLGGVATGDETGDVRISGKTAGGTVSGPADAAQGFIKSMGGIAPDKPQKPVDVYKIAERMAMNATGGDYGDWPDLSYSERLNYINDFARQIWDDYNPGMPFKPLEEYIPSEAEIAPVPEAETEKPNVFKRTWNWLAGGGEEMPQSNLPEAAGTSDEEVYNYRLKEAQSLKKRGLIDQAKYDKYVEDLNKHYGK